jgi:hypothetical protein
MQINVHIEGVDRTISRLDMKRLRKPLKEFFKAAGKEGAGALASSVPRLTGKTARAAKSSYAGGARGFWARAFFRGRGYKTGRSHIAHFLEMGTPPHQIKAKGAALNTPNGPFRSVQHPGARPHPFMGEAGARTDRGIGPLLDRLGAEIAGLLGR